MRPSPHPDPLPQGEGTALCGLPPHPDPLPGGEGIVRAVFTLTLTLSRRERGLLCAIFTLTLTLSRGERGMLCAAFPLTLTLSRGRGDGSVRLCQREGNALPDCHQAGVAASRGGIHTQGAFNQQTLQQQVGFAACEALY